jgi:hypothetical protein
MMKSVNPTDRVDQISKQDFLRQYKKPGKPVVIEDLTRDWPARVRWSAEYFQQIAGDKLVPLYDSQPSRDRKHQHAPAAEMPLRVYLQLLDAGENDLRMFFYNILAETPELRKDFAFPDLGLPLFKKLPVLFVGGRGARVQMHFDIDHADILLCHFGGKKRVLLFHPDQTPYLYKVPFSFSSLFDINYEQPDYERYPALQYAQGEIAELNHGDVLYIPPGYWHYIMYDEIGFSMSLRAFPRNPLNLYRMLRNLMFTRTIEGLMRRFVGQRWNDRNERLSIRRTQTYLMRKGLLD